jgi:hypothetical protein
MYMKMNILGKKLKTAILTSGIALGVMFGSTQQSKAAFYDNYYTLYSTYLSYYQRTGIAQYYWDAVAFHYYYLAGYYGDYFGRYYDRFGFKSTNYAGSTYAAYYYNTYAYYGDYYWRL